MEPWFVLSIVVAFFWGTSGVLAKYSTPRLGVARIALLIAVVEGLMYAVAYLFLREDVPISLEDGLLATVSCMIGISGYLFYFESIMDGPVAIAGTISAAYPALTVVGAVLLLSETLTGVQALGVALVILCVIALSYEPDPTGRFAMTRRSLFFSFAAFAAWGVWSLTIKVAIDRVTADNIFGFYVISSLTAPLIYSYIRRVRPMGTSTEKATRLAWWMGAAALAVNVLGAFAYSYALEEGTASLVVPVSSAYPLVTIVLAVAVLREKVNRFHFPALAGVVMGLVLIALSV